MINIRTEYILETPIIQWHETKPIFCKYVFKSLQGQSAHFYNLISDLNSINENASKVGDNANL